MIWSIGFLIDTERAAKERLRFFRAGGIAEQRGQIVEADRNRWMIRTASSLAHGECAAIEWLGSCVFRALFQEVASAIEEQVEGFDCVRGGAPGGFDMR